MKENKILVWDLPIRLWHWILVLTVIIAIVTAQLQEFEIHMLAGQFIVFLLIFRLFWGFMGGKYTRFSAILRKESFSVGHSRSGWLAVVAIVTILSAQVITGMFSVEVPYYGPWSDFVSYEFGEEMMGHHRKIRYAVVAIILLHLCAILYYKWRKAQNLTSAMVTGYKDHQTDSDPIVQTENESPDPTLRRHGIFCAILSIIVSFALTNPSFLL